MIVYAEREERVRAAVMLAEIQQTFDPVERDILFGQFESGVVDEVCPEIDDVTPLTSALRTAALTGDVAFVRAHPLPDRVRIRPAEGFAWYAVYPELYADAAKSFAAASDPESCTVIGIRSIGTTLSAAVIRALRCPVWSFTVRPRGHPFHRQLQLSHRLEAQIRGRLSDWFLIVDEGPGLSGSSFISVARKLGELGVPDSRIVFFPSHEADPNAFVSEESKRAWPRYRKYFEPFRPERFLPAPSLDLSGGLWRDVVPCDAAVQPWHERRKYLSSGGLWKFEGLGRYGQSKLDRAHVLAAAGYVPEPTALSNGFLSSSWIDGKPASSLDESLLQQMAHYLAFLASEFETGEPAPYDSLVTMIRENTGIACPARNALISDGPAVALDGRMLPHEWIGTGKGWIKTDSLDHHDDHFFPGCQDIAWDIAGASVEFDCAPEIIAGEYLRLRTDRTLLRRLQFYVLAYLSYRIGYASMAEQALGPSLDSRRFRELKRRYTVALESIASRPASSSA